VKHTFKYWPIESAPKDRAIAVFDGLWFIAHWTTDLAGGWVHVEQNSRVWLNPTHWAEIASMAPTLETGSPLVDTSQVTQDEASIEWAVAVIADRAYVHGHRAGNNAAINEKECKRTVPSIADFEKATAILQSASLVSEVSEVEARTAFDEWRRRPARVKLSPWNSWLACNKWRNGRNA
jgi:hypothetical protein